MAHFDQITEEQANAIKNGSALNLPNRPTERGYTAAQVKAALANPVVGDNNSLLALLKGLITKLNEQLGNVDNTSDENKPVSTAVQTALDGKVNNGNWVADISVGMNDNYILSIALKDADGNTIGTAKEVDLPLEEMILSATYADGEITLTLKTGQTVTINISDLVSGLVKEAAGTKTDGDLSYWKDGELDDSGIPKDKVAHVDGSYDLFTAGLAKNFQGRAASAVSANFTFRTAGGTADIGNPQATIKSIYGKTLVWNQLIQNGNIVDTTGWNGNVFGYSDISASDNTLSVSYNSGTYVNVRHAISIPNSHKVLISFFAKSATDNTSYVVRLQGSTTVDTNVTFSNVFKEHNLIVTAPNNVTYIHWFASRASDNTKNFGLRNVKVFDLTTMFGAGNEPTADAFKALFPLPYYAYNAGALLHFNGTGLKTVGFNQWDEEWQNGYYDSSGVFTSNASFICSKNLIPVFPNTQYYAQASETITFVYHDANGAFISRDGSSTNPKTTPENAHYMHIYCDGTTYKNDVCINLSWSGYRNGEYEPYWASTIALPIATHFPTGMKSVGSVFDELTEKKAIQRIGTRDYEAGDESDATVVTDGTTTCYALDTPVETDVDLALTYRVDDFGTEQLLPENEATPTTTPFDGMIHYAMNAVDKLNRLPDSPSTTGYYTVYYNSATGLCSFVAEGRKVYQHNISMKNNDDEWLYFTCVNKNPVVTYDGATEKLTGVPNGIYAAHTVDYGAGVVIVTGGAVTFYYGSSSKAWNAGSSSNDDVTTIY